MQAGRAEVRWQTGNLYMFGGRSDDRLAIAATGHELLAQMAALRTRRRTPRGASFTR